MKSILQTKILMIVTAICVVGYIAFGYFFPETGLDNLAPTDRLNLKKNIVVMGVDERSDDVGRSDTLFVVMFDSSNKSASLLSVPRDTRVRIDGHGWDKINHAYAYGGRELTQKTVEELLGIKINNYVMVDFKGFTGLVDAIGGIDIDVEKDMYYHDTWDGFTVDLKKGRQHLDGKTAIQYVRFRDEEGDIGRIRRQQHFLMAVYDKITSADMLLHIPGLAKQLTSMVKTDMPLGDMIDLGRALHSMVKEKGLSMAMVPGTPKYIDGISYWLPDITKPYPLSRTFLREREKQADKDKDAGKNTASQEASSDSRGVVRLVNCSGSKTAGAEAAARLRNAGFEVISGGSGEIIANTVVVSTTNNGAVVNRLSNVPFAHQMRISRDGAADCDGVIMLGSDFK